MHNFCIIWAHMYKTVTDQHPAHLHLQCHISTALSQWWFSVECVFNSCLHRKCIFCTAQLEGCIFADLKEERKTCSTSCATSARAAYIEYIPATGTVKCCGVGNSWIIESFSCFFSPVSLKCTWIWAFSLFDSTNWSLGVFEDDCKKSKWCLPIITVDVSSLRLPQ